MSPSTSFGTMSERHSNGRFGGSGGHPGPGRATVRKPASVSMRVAAGADDRRRLAGGTDSADEGGPCRGGQAAVRDAARPAGCGLANGVADRVANDRRIARKEIFGLIATVRGRCHEDELMARHRHRLRIGGRPVDSRPLSRASGHHGRTKSGDYEPRRRRAWNVRSTGVRK